MSEPRDPRPAVVMTEDLRSLVRGCALWIDDVTQAGGEEAYRELEELAQAYRQKCKGLTVGQVDGVSEARKLYRSFGIDPTRTRPSSEALLKRALQGRSLYRLGSVVDVCNYASLHELLPIGLYDRDAIQGETAHIRRGQRDEEYTGIRKGPVHVEGRLCVADELGAFGSPTSDSLRTCVTEESTRLLGIVFAPADGSPRRIRATAEALAQGLARHAGGILVKRESFPRDP